MSIKSSGLSKTQAFMVKKNYNLIKTDRLGDKIITNELNIQQPL